MRDHVEDASSEMRRVVAGVVAFVAAFACLFVWLATSQPQVDRDAEHAARAFVLWSTGSLPSRVVCRGATRARVSMCYVRMTETASPIVVWCGETSDTCATDAFSAPTVRP